MKKFEPGKWLKKQNNKPTSTYRTQAQTTTSLSDVDIVMSRVHTDIAPTYEQWVNLGFALSSEMGEAGRSYYHHCSSYYSNYNSADTDKQYDKCLRSKRTGITIKTFFLLAKNAGININTKNK